MIVTCKECGKMYRIDPSKLKGKVARTVCRTCGNTITIRQPKDREKDKRKKATAQKGLNRLVFGLKGKIFTLFFVVPIALIITAGYLFIGQLHSMSAIISEEGAKMVTQMAEDIILDKAAAVAREVKLYLDTHPDLKKEDFNNTPEFVDVVMQKVGKTGYTIIVERETEYQPEFIWVHPNQKIVGIDITDAMKSKLGDKWKRWNEIRSKPYITKGYYLWFDDREKYCAGVPIKGTPFNIVSSTYMDEFTQPLKNMQLIMNDSTQATKQIVITIISVTALLVAIITNLYGHILTTRIIKLTNVTDRISLGDMEVHIENTTKDELGDLAQAISRMQYSIRMALERLSPRRSRQAN